jgi:hypothetical protein
MSGGSLALLLVIAGSAAAQQPQITALPPPVPVTVSYHGGAVAALPDVNGDGQDDVAVSSYFQDDNIGRVYVYSGASGQLIRVLVSPNREEDHLYGTSLSAVPDIDGDGVADIVVGAPMDSPGTSPQGCGRAYVYSGATGRLLWKLLPPTPQLFGQFGYAVAGLHDLDGDGRGEIAVGAPAEQRAQGGDDEGRVHIYSGATGRRIRTILAPTDRHAGEFGYSLAAIGDLSGDGRDDLIIGDHRGGPDGARGGLVHVYSPANGLRLRTLQSPNNQDDGRFGYAVAAVPDANRDGRPDILVGAPREFNRIGRAYLFSGTTGALLAAVQSPGSEADGRFGEAVAGLDDFNGDGRGDFIVGAPHEDPGFSNSDNGRAYVYSGAAGRFLQRLVPTNPRVEDYFGYSVVGLRDRQGGRPRIVVGAPGDDSPSHGRSGTAYIYRY